MSRAKKASKRKSRACAVPLLGAAGLSLSMVSGAPAATVGPTAHEITLGEEEISDVSLATFYVFDKENVGGSEPGVQLVGHGGGGCRHGGGGGCHTAAAEAVTTRLRRLSPRRLRRLRAFGGAAAVAVEAVEAAGAGGTASESGHAIIEHKTNVAAKPVRPSGEAHAIKNAKELAMMGKEEDRHRAGSRRSAGERYK